MITTRPNPLALLAFSPRPRPCFRPEFACAMAGLTPGQGRNSVAGLLRALLRAICLVFQWLKDQPQRRNAKSALPRMCAHAPARRGRIVCCGVAALRFFLNLLKIKRKEKQQAPQRLAFMVLRLLRLILKPLKTLKRVLFDARA